MSASFLSNRLIIILTIALYCLAIASMRSFGQDKFIVDDKVSRKIKTVYGEETFQKYIEWLKMIKDNKDRKIEEKLSIVNIFFNQLINITDEDNWGAADYWATPLELFWKKGGDCEDLAIAKYFTLKEMGVNDTYLRLTYVRLYLKDKGLKIIPHMVLSYYPGQDEDPLVLDNIRDDILPASRRPDIIPTYNFNVEGLWDAKKRGAGKLLGSSKRIQMWQDIQNRMNKGY